MKSEKLEYSSIILKNLLGRPLYDVEKKNSPDVIYYSGSMGIPLQGSRVSIIGTRQPSKEGLLTAEKVAKVLIKNNVTITSGLAKGIDSIGHKTAIENGGKTIAVLGTPLNKTYPKENTELQEEIMKNHLAISQYPVGHNTIPKDFALRNHLMALISDASVIVEAKDNSGTLYHGWETLRLGRPLFICKQPTSNSELKWVGKMIGYGAIELNDPLDILEHIPSSV